MLRRNEALLMLVSTRTNAQVSHLGAWHASGADSPRGDVLVVAMNELYTHRQLKTHYFHNHKEPNPQHSVALSDATGSTNAFLGLGQSKHFVANFVAKIFVAN